MTKNTTWNTRKPGHTDYKIPSFKIDISDYKTVSTITVNNKIKTQYTSINDAEEISMYHEMANTVMKITTRDTSSGTWNVHRHGSGWQIYKKQSDAMDVIISEIPKHDPQSPAPTKHFLEWMMDTASLWPLYSTAPGFYPMGPYVYEHAGIYYRNEWVENGINPTLPLTDDERTIIAEWLNGIIRINLCNRRGNKTYDEIMNIIHDKHNDSEREFRYVIHNIATMYMRPGRKIPTNLALCGQPGGMGKNYIRNIVQKMLGGNMCTIPADIDGKFNEWAINKTFILLDEIQNRPADFNAFIKKYTTNTEIGANIRYIGTVDTINMGNYWIFSNTLKPYNTDSTERRTIFIRTFHDSEPVIEQQRKTFATAMAEKYDDTYIATLFAKMVHEINIDRDVLKYRETELAAQIIGSSGTGFEKFMKSENISAALDKQHRIRIADLTELYNAWAVIHRFNPESKTDIRTQLEQKIGKWVKRAANDSRFIVAPGLTTYRNGVPPNIDADDWDGDMATSAHQTVVQPDEHDSRCRDTGITATPATPHGIDMDAIMAGASARAGLQYQHAKKMGASDRMARAIARETGGASR